MKNFGYLLLLSLFFFSCNEDSSICIDPSQVDAEYNCDSTYNPVCGCDNITYFNACEAQYKIGLQNWEEGQCNHSCSYIDTLTVFTSDENCTVLTDFATFYEVNYAPTGVSWEQNQEYLVNYFTASVTPQCGGSQSLNITCVKAYNPYCYSIIPIQGDDSFLPNDSVQIDSINFTEPCLTVSYSYLGGCNDTRMDLFHIIDSSSFESTRLQIRYDNGEGPCSDTLTAEASFDLSSLQVEGLSSINIEIDCNGDLDFYHTFTYEY